MSKTVTVAAPLCAPSRAAITDRVRQQLARYEANVYGISASLEKQGGIEQYWKVSVKFSDDYAGWGEYLLLRHGYWLLGQPINKHNPDWAKRYTHGALCESSCKDKPKGATIGDIANAAPPPAWKDRAPAKKGSLQW